MNSRLSFEPKFDPFRAFLFFSIFRGIYPRFDPRFDYCAQILWSHLKAHDKLRRLRPKTSKSRYVANFYRHFKIFAYLRGHTQKKIFFFKKILIGQKLTSERSLTIFGPKLENGAVTLPPTLNIFSLIFQTLFITFYDL